MAQPITQHIVRARPLLQMAAIAFGASLLACGSSSSGNGGTGSTGQPQGTGQGDASSSGGGTVPTGDASDTVVGTDASVASGDDGGPGSPTPAADGGQSTATGTGLHTVMGSGAIGTIVDKDGKVVHLRGVSMEGPQYMCDMNAAVFDPISPATQASLTAMKSWGINAVRIPMNEDCWLGINGVQMAYGGANYQSAILTWVNLVTQTNGMYAILDLHYSAPGSTLATVQGLMPDADHSPAFWSGVAAAYKGNGSVIFDLFNEPNTGGDGAADYDCWRDGDVACNINHYSASDLGTNSLQGITTCNNGTCNGTASFKVAGMQTLLTAVRTAGANNLVLLDGIGDAWNLGLWPSHVPTDTLSPPNVAAGWHFYDTNAGCDSTCQGPSFYLQYTDGNQGGGSGAGVGGVEMAGYPIIVGETGIYATNGPGWYDGFLTWLDGQGIAYFAWAWATAGTPSMITDTTNFTPSDPNGTLYKAHLAKLGLAP
jgi:endoglucanase